MNDTRSNGAADQNATASPTTDAQTSSNKDCTTDDDLGTVQTDATPDRCGRCGGPLTARVATGPSITDTRNQPCGCTPVVEAQR
jgi:hypothetical protein